MLGLLITFSCLAGICIAAIRRPAMGLVGFYGFYLLDPLYNWRWAIPSDIDYQKLIVGSLAIGFFVSGFKITKQAKPSRLGIASLLLFFAICSISAIQSVAPDITERFMSVAWKQIAVAIFAILVLNNFKEVKALLVVAVLCHAYNAYQINLDYFETGTARFAVKGWGSAGLDNNTYSILTIPIIGISLSIGLHEQRFRYRVLYLSIALVQIHQLMLMGSRGCMVGLLPMLAFIIFKIPRTRQNIREVACVGLAAFALAGPSVVKEFSSSFASAEGRDNSAQSRFYLWDAGLRITMDYPILGAGPNAARVLVPDYYEGGLTAKKKALHNLFFDVSAGTGLIGFFLFFTFIGIPVLACMRVNQRHKTIPPEIRLAIAGGLIGYLTASFFSSGLLIESSYILIIAGYAAINISELEHSRRVNASAGCVIASEHHYSR